MAFVNLPIVGATTNSIQINTEHIIELRVVYNNVNFGVRAVVGIGTQYVLNLPGHPFATEAEAITAMQTYIGTFSA